VKHIVSNSRPNASSVARRGFTLVELLAVVAVMLIVLKLTLPSLDGILGSDAQAMARTQLIGDLNKARSMALEKGVPVHVVFMPLYDDIWPSNKTNAVALVDGFNTNHKQAYFKSDKSINDLLGLQLAAYAIYAERLPGDQPNKPSRQWLTDWKKLPESHHFSLEDLAAMPVRVKVPHVKGLKKVAWLILPAIKYNGRGELEGAGLRGVYFSVNKGGVFPPGKDQNGLFNAVDADPPESLANEARQWLHINAITGRAEIEGLSEGQAGAGGDLNHRLASRYNVYIYSVPEWPADFSNKIPRFTGYNRAWSGSGPWSPVEGNYIIKAGANGRVNPVYQNVPNRKRAIELKWALESLASKVGTKKIGVRIESIQ
jgi:prepilin-type N-terminal cleavage/methylation domain-containing protein